MSCSTLQSGDRFVSSAIAIIDCHAQSIGSYGFATLADPGSPVALALSAILAIFVALFGIRMMSGTPMTGRDLVLDVLKVAIALTLATSWPAWRVLGYDLLIHGPGEIFRALGSAAQLPGSAGDLPDRLQNVDDGLAAYTAFGSGRLGVAAGDWFQLGLARSAFVTGVIVPTALVRLSAGLMLALAPLVAGLLLFRVSEAVFTGWVRGLAMLFLASIAVSVVQATELALLEPWLSEALRRRASDFQTLDAPVEAVAITLSFALVSLGIVAIMARVAFNTGRALMPSFDFSEVLRPHRNREPQAPAPQIVREETVSRARQLAYAINESIARDERTRLVLQGGPGSAAASRFESSDDLQPSRDRLGSSYRRTTTRHSGAAARRDRT